MSYVFCRKFTIIHSEFCQLMMILYHICNIETRWKIFCKTKNCCKTILNMFYVLITSYFYIIHHIFSNYLFHHFQYVTFSELTGCTPTALRKTSVAPTLVHHFHHISLAPDPHINAVSKHLCADQIAFWSLCDNLCCWQSI